MAYVHSFLFIVKTAPSTEILRKNESVYLEILPCALKSLVFDIINFAETNIEQIYQTKQHNIA